MLGRNGDDNFPYADGLEVLVSLYPHIFESVLREILIRKEGNVQKAIKSCKIISEVTHRDTKTTEISSPRLTGKILVHGQSAGQRSTAVGVQLLPKREIGTLSMANRGLLPNSASSKRDMHLSKPPSIVKIPVSFYNKKRSSWEPAHLALSGESVTVFLKNGSTIDVLFRNCSQIYINCDTRQHQAAVQVRGRTANYIGFQEHSAFHLIRSEITSNFDRIANVLAKHNNTENLTLNKPRVGTSPSRYNTQDVAPEAIRRRSPIPVRCSPDRNFVSPRSARSPVPQMCSLIRTRTSTAPREHSLYPIPTRKEGVRCTNTTSIRSSSLIRDAQRDYANRPLTQSKVSPTRMYCNPITTTATTY